MPEERLCSTCGQPIHPLRLKAMPNAKQCVQCARGLETGKGAPLGVMVYDHKTGGHMQIVNSDQLHEMNRMDRRGIPRKKLES